jgi:hypothetical protein
MTFKEKVYQAYELLLSERVALLQVAMTDLIESSNNETKSSAGDKYETTREMLQLEKAKVVTQLKDAQQQKLLFEQVTANPLTNKIEKGSLVKTSKGYLYIHIALGKVVVNGITVMSLSPQSPLGSKLIGLRPNSSISFNGISYLIETIE